MAENNGAFPDLVIDMGSSAQRSGPPPISPLGQTVEGALREILAWRPKANDPRGFVAALNQAFSVTDVDGHTEWAWTPRSYAIQADMGAVTGAQASIYARAKAALDQSIPLLEGLYPLRADADTQDVEANRSVVRSTLTELVSELGMVGGPRLQRVDTLFRTLLGTDSEEQDAERVGGLLALMRERFGLERARVNTIDEEQNLTNYFILGEHVIALNRSWRTQRHFFDRHGRDVFLGTQLVLLARAMAVVAESVQQSYFVMDSVFLSDAERQTIQLTFGSNRMTIAELLSWVERFASEEGPRVIREAGKDGVIALRPIVGDLDDLVGQMLRMSKDSNRRIQRGFHSERVQATLEELTSHLRELNTLFDQLKRQPQVRILAMEPDRGPRAPNLRMVIDGEGFQPGMTVYLTEWGEGTQQIPGKVRNVIGTSEIKATFDLSGAASNKYALVVRSPEPESTLTNFDQPFWIDEELTKESPEIDDVDPSGAPTTGPVAVLIQGSKFHPGAEVTLTKAGETTIQGTKLRFTKDGQNIEVTFQLRNRATGEWVVNVRNPADQKATQWDGTFIVSAPPVIELATASLVDPSPTNQDPIGTLDITGENFADRLTIRLFPSKGEPIKLKPEDQQVVEPHTHIQSQLPEELKDKLSTSWHVQVINADGGTSNRVSLRIATDS